MFSELAWKKYFAPGNGGITIGITIGMRKTKSFPCELFVLTYQKQPPEVFRNQRCSYKCRKMCRKTPVPESFFNKDAGCQSLFVNKAAGLKRLWHWCFPVNFAKYLRKHFLQNISGRLVLTYVFQKLPRNSKH